jgi:hypothetical protein
MFYKMAILNSQLSYSLVLKLLSNISKFYIIITPTISINYYIIYLILESGHSVGELKDLKNLIIYNYAYNKIIYKIFRLYLSNYSNISNNFILIDYAFYNLRNIKIYNYLKASKYLNTINTNKKLKHILYNYFHDFKYQIFWIYHKNISYLTFIKNYISNYNNNIIIFESNKLQSDLNQLSSILSHRTSNYLYIFINIANNINDYSQNFVSNIISFIKKNLKSIKQKYNILLLSTDQVVDSTYYNNLITYFTFSNLIYS